MADEEQPKQPSEWVGKVEEHFRIAEDWQQWKQIMTNLNYYVGNQWIGWNRELKRVQALPTEPGQERITLNRIRPVVIRLLAKHTKNKLKFDVIPASKEERDIDAAQAAHKFLQFLWQELDMPMRTKEIFLNGLVKGWCAVKTWFDPTAGDDITPSEGEIGYEEGMDSIHMGQLRTRVCDPMTIFVDPSARTEEEIRWIGEKNARDVDEIFEEYGKKVAADANIDYLNAYDVTNVNQEGIGYTETKKKENMAMVYELWIKPCKKYPGGVKVTMAGGQILDLDEQAGEIPYQLFGYIPVPSSVKYEAVVKDLIPVQRSINIKRSMIATHAKRLGNAMWLIPLGSGVDEEELTDETGGFVHYTPIGNMKPERAMAPDIPSFFDRDLQNDAIDLDDMSGSREVSQGRMPSGLDTLGGLEIMVEQENEKLTVAAQNYEQGMKKVMQRLLRLLKKHYTEERQGRILGEDNEIELISFNGSDLTGYEDIVIVQGSSLPEMKAAQQERILLMWNSGAIVKKDGTPDVQTFLRLMGMGDSTELFEQHELDENKAKLENRQFQMLAQDQNAMMALEQYMTEMQMYRQTMQQAQVQGVDPMQLGIQEPQLPPGLPIVRDFYDHDVHMYQHNNFRKSSDYEELPPILQSFIDMHFAEHEEMLMAPQLQEQQAQMQMQQQQMGMEQEKMQQEAQFKQRKLDIDAMNAASKMQIAQRSGRG